MNKNKLFIIIASLVLLVPFLFFITEKTSVTDIYNKPPLSTDAKTTSEAPTAQTDFTNGNDRPIVQNSKTEGTVRDNNGNISSTPPESQWSKSVSGEITVYSPPKNSVLVSGGTLSGASTLSKVSYRLIDDVSGVISSGDISVVNGKFSGTFDFATSGSQGRLDIFSTNDTGKESNNVEIPIRFK